MSARHLCGAMLLSSLALLLPNLAISALAAIPVTPPSGGPTSDVVYSNFLGISIELSFINYYFGNTSSSIPQPFVNYLEALHARSSGQPVRLRLGGNSMDSSTYVPGQPDIIEFTDPAANANDQPVNYGPQLFDVMNTVSDKVGGVEYLIGLSLRDPNSSNIPLLAGDAQKALGDKLDAFLLGNEPDLYSRHGNRPGIANYTVDDYIGDYSEVFGHLQTTPQGDVLSQNKIAGPTICCFWDVASILQSGWFDQFDDHLKYITLQHYPQDNCQGTHSLELNYYLEHANAVKLALWQNHGVQVLKSSSNPKPLIMDEFSSASCGGVPGISDTFGAAMWSVDYALQLATVGYSAAYLHLRERGITYNLFDPPDAVAGGAGAWTTNPTYYAYLPLSEALSAPSGSKVADLNIQNSMNDVSQSVAGYAIYDASSSNVHSLVLFNFANATGGPVEFALPASFFPSGANAVVRYLAAPNVNEKTQISWGNQTYAGVTDGVAVLSTASSAVPDKTVPCSSGCSIEVPGPAIAVVFVGSTPTLEPSPTGGSSSSSATPAPTGQTKTKNAATAFSQLPTLWVLAFASFLMTLL